MVSIDLKKKSVSFTNQPMRAMFDLKKSELLTTPHHSTRSKERRLRKMSQIFPLSSFAFSVQGQVLCVGMLVVFRVVMNLQPTTCVVPPTRRDAGNWVIAMSKTKFVGFYKEACAVLSRIQTYLPHTIARETAEYAFLHTLQCVLQRHHHLLSTLFDDPDNIHEGQMRLESFMMDCWKSVEIILPVIVIENHCSPSLNRDVMNLYLLLRDFMSFPENVLERNHVYYNAIMNLEDQELSNDDMELKCSICLDSMTKLLDNIEDNDAVKVPCGHFFHEDCIIAWLHRNPSCPQCRAPCNNNCTL